MRCMMLQKGDEYLKPLSSTNFRLSPMVGTYEVEYSVVSVVEGLAAGVKSVISMIVKR